MKNSIERMTFMAKYDKLKISVFYMQTSHDVFVTTLTMFVVEVI